MPLTEQEIQKLEQALDRMRLAKDELLASKNTRFEPEARRKLLDALDEVNMIIKSFNKETDLINV